MKTICLRGAFPTDNKTAQCEAEGIRDRVLGHGRSLLEGWRKKFTSMFPSETCSIPDPSTYRFARLAGGSSVMSDGCNQARKMQELIKVMIVEDYINALGEGGQEKWASMSNMEKNEAVRVYVVTCQNHLRNTMIRHGAKHERDFMNATLEEVLGTIDADIRVSMDVESICRAANKEFMFSGSSLYAKGKGASFLSWVIHKHPHRVIYVLYRADLGSRLDSTTEAALALYMNREVYVEYLIERISSAKDDNKLELALITALTSKEVIAAIRARAMLHIKITMPMRFITNNTDLNYSPADMGPVVDALYNFFGRMQADGNALMDIDLDIFRDAFETEDEKDAYTSFKRSHFSRLGHSIDGTKRGIPVWRLAVNEVFEPADATNKSTDAFVPQLLQCWATGMKEGILKTPQKDHLTEGGGSYSVGKVTAQMREDLEASESSNDISERVFAVFGRIRERSQGIAFPAASSAAAEALNHHVVPAKPKTAGKAEASFGKSSRESSTPYIDLLPKNEVVALFEYARVGKSEFKAKAKSEVQGQLNANYEAFVQQIDKNLLLKSKQFARASSYHQRHRINTIKELRASLAKAGSEKNQIELLKEQLSIVVIGYGWTEHKTPWSCAKDKYVGSLEDLTAKAEAMIQKDGKRQAPAEPPVPESGAKKIQPLGTLTLQTSQLLQAKKATAAELRDRAKREQLEKEIEALAAKEAQRDKFAVGQPETPPEINVGMHLEILTEITEPGDDEGDAPREYNQWLAADVVSAAADPSSLSGKAKKGARRAADWYLVKYECDGEEEWMRLRAANFNCRSKGSWRLDLDYANGETGAAAKAEVQEEGDETEEDEEEEDEEGEEEEGDEEEEEEEEEEQDSDSD